MVNLPAADLAILLAYLAITLAAGVLPARRGDSSEAFLLGRRAMPWWLLLGSIVATETSTVTFLSLPGKTFGTTSGCTFLQLAMGYIIGRCLVATLLLPEFFRGAYFTAYEVLQKRFGPGVRTLASVVFLLTRNISDGLRLFLTAFVVEAAFGFNFALCVVLIAVVTAIYSSLGGVTAVVYNDFAQLIVYVLGGIFVLWLLIQRVPDGAVGLWDFAESTGRARVFDTHFSFTGGSINIWAGLLGGMFLTLSTHGADHLMVQRYLCAKSQRSAAVALVLSGPVVALQFMLFLAIGAGLAYYYSVTTVPYNPAEGDRVFANFLVHEVPTGLRGLMLAAVMAAAMSTLSSSLNSSAGVAVKDLLGRWTVGMAEKQNVLVARLATVAFAVVQSMVAMIAYYTGMQQSVIDAVLALAGFSTGLLLGLYALGMLAGRARTQVGVAAFVAGLVVALFVVFGTDVSWPWYTLVGCSVTLVVGLLLNTLLPSVEDSAHD